MASIKSGAGIDSELADLRKRAAIDMQLTYYTDYSLRVLMYLAHQPRRRVSISEIAERYDISRNHLMKVVHNLSRGGFIKSHRGKGGGSSWHVMRLRSISAKSCAIPRVRSDRSNVSMLNVIDA